MTYCSVQKVRLVSGLDSSDIGDSEIRDIRDEVATSEMNDDINETVENERVDREISDEKQNTIDGSNKTFYLKELHQNELYLSDKNNDGRVTSKDLDVYYIDEDDNRVTDLQINIKDLSIGKFTLADSNGDALKEDEVGKIFADYEVASVNEHGYKNNDFSSGGPDSIVETACAQLTASYCFTNIEASKLKNFSIGDVTIRNQSEGASIMKERYMDSVKRITQRQVVKTGQNENSAGGVFAMQN